jgi:hypothetical protein
MDDGGDDMSVLNCPENALSYSASVQYNRPPRNPKACTGRGAKRRPLKTSCAATSHSRWAQCPLLTAEGLRLAD